MPNFNDKLQGLLGGGNASFDLGLGLLGAAGPSLQPHSVGQDLAAGVQFASSRQRAAAENDLLRQRFERGESRQQAIEGLPGLLSNPNATQQELLGGLLGASPDGVSSAIAGAMLTPERQFEAPEIVQIADLLYEPDSAEWRAYVERGDVTDQLREALTTLQIQQAQGEVDDEARERVALQVEAESAVSTQLRNLDEITTLIGDLEGTPLEPGSALAQAAMRAPTLAAFTTSVYDALGQGEDTDQLLAKFQRLGQLTQTESIERIYKSMAGRQAITNSQMGQRLQAKPGAHLLPDANRAIIADMYEETLGAGEHLSMDVNPQRYQAVIESLRAPLSSGGSGAIVTPEMIGSINDLETLQQLIPMVRNSGDVALALALQARRDELTSQ